jgi:hypothetical protein
VIISAVGLRDSFIVSSGIVYFESPTLTNIPSMIAKVKGIWKITVVPLPGML